MTTPCGRFKAAKFFLTARAATAEILLRANADAARQGAAGSAERLDKTTRPFRQLRSIAEKWDAIGVAGAGRS